VSDLRRNIELKARCADLAAAREAALRLGATEVGVLEQLDTYFRVPNGRLKLRETTGKTAELIWYARPDHAESRRSDYRIVPVPEPAALKAALNAAIGTRGTVRKRRALLMWHHVRIHLDDVAGLGTFLEFEAVLSAPEDDSTARDRLATLGDALGVRAQDRIARSYSDLSGF
jgi:adenylate cyclase class IV